jgi:hypothetical protein
MRSIIAGECKNRRAIQEIGVLGNSHYSVTCLRYFLKLILLKLCGLTEILTCFTHTSRVFNWQAWLLLASANNSRPKINEVKHVQCSKGSRPIQFRETGGHQNASIEPSLTRTTQSQNSVTPSTARIAGDSDEVSFCVFRK